MLQSYFSARPDDHADVFEFPSPTEADTYSNPMISRRGRPDPHATGDVPLTGARATRSTPA
jgi:hypothetical protein